MKLGNIGGRGWWTASLFYRNTIGIGIAFARAGRCFDEHGNCHDMAEGKIYVGPLLVCLSFPISRNMKRKQNKEGQHRE